MRIEINGTPQEVEADTLDAVLEELGHPHESVATALNGEFVARGERGAARLREGDRVEVLAPMKGG